MLGKHTCTSVSIPVGNVGTTILVLVGKISVYSPPDFDAAEIPSLDFYEEFSYNEVLRGQIMRKFPPDSDLQNKHCSVRSQWRWVLFGNY